MRPDATLAQRIIAAIRGYHPRTMDATILRSVLLFALAGLSEIGGGYLV